jgi:exopolysaccharide biosynthesis polyprenyl glycosylphosphotransferase
MTTPNLAIQNVKQSSSAVGRATKLKSPRFLGVWTPMIQLISDFLTVVVALWTFGWLFPSASIGREFAHLQYLPIVISVAALGTALIFRYTRLYARGVTPLNIGETEVLVRAGVFSFLLLALVAHNVGIAGGTASLCAVLSVGTLMLQRYASRYLRRCLERHDLRAQHLLAYGDNNDSQSVYAPNSRLGRAVERGSEISDASVIPATSSKQVPGSVRNWGSEERATGNRNLGEVVFADPYTPEDTIHSDIEAFEGLNLGLSPLFEPATLPKNRSYYDIVGGPIIARLAIPADEWARVVVKRVADLTLCVPGLVISLPLFLVASILIKLDSDGPVFFRQDRIGKDGRVFRLWKFRSMHRDAPQYERSPLSDADARLTGVGRVIRRFSIDELPQLINVLRGEMSLVGPRPEMPFIVDQYGPFERRRLHVRPGITGLWQISPARAMPIHENMEYDLYYIHRQNVYLDLAILLRTVTAVVRGIGAA